MFKSTLLGIVLLFAASTATAGYIECRTYQCHAAQQEIQYLYDAIWFERQKPFPCWPCIEDAQRRIQYLQTIR